MTGESPQPNESLEELYGSLAPGQFYRRDGARLTGQPDPSLLKVSAQNAELHDAYHMFDKAHIVMLDHCGILPDGIAAQLLQELREMENDDHIEIRRESGYGCHAGEAYVIDELGEDVGGWLHIGRSTRDLREVGKRVVARRKLLLLIENALALCETYIERAGEYKSAVVPTYTRVQHAQISTIGFHLLSLERPLERDIQRLWGNYSRINTSPAGAAAGTATNFAIDRVETADLLGFDDVADNATDVDKSSDIHLEGNFVPVILLHDIASAVDLFLLWSSLEFGLVELPDEFCGTSSIMPQKKNPLALVKIKTNVDDAIGDAVSQLVASRSFDTRGDVSLSVFDATARSMEIFNEILKTIRFDEQRGEELVHRDWALATDLAGSLVREAEIPWRSAHQIVSVLCRRCIEEDTPITEVRPEAIESIAEEYLGEEIAIDRRAIEAVLDPERAVRSRAGVSGSPAENSIEEQIHATEEFVLQQYERLTAERDRITSVQNRLEEEVDEITAQIDQ